MIVKITTGLLCCLSVAIINSTKVVAQGFVDNENYDTDALNMPEDEYNFWIANDYELYQDFMSNYESGGRNCPCDFDIETSTADCVFKELRYKIPDCVPNATQVLDLTDNKLQYRPGFFDRFTDLRKLSLRWNEFLEVFRNVKINGFSKLEFLDLSFCSLGHLDSSYFTGLVNLKTLSLEENFIRRIDKDTFSETPKLINLDLSFNIITVIDSYTFSGLPSLTNLNLSHNPDPYKSGSPLSFDRHSFAGLSSLKYLSLEGIAVANSTSFPVDLLRPLRSLEELNLFRFCRYSEIGDFNCPKLHKHLSNIPLLRRLNIDVDWLPRLGSGFKTLTSLQEVYFLVASDVEIESISNKTFENLRNSPLSAMSIIFDAVNPKKLTIHSVMPYTFSFMTNLQELDFSFESGDCSTAFTYFAIGLDQTKLRRLQFSVHCGSEYIRYSGNGLASLSDTQLEYLDLSHGSMASINNWLDVYEGDFFKKLPRSLKVLNLQQNQIGGADLKNFHKMHQLLVFNISNQRYYHEIQLQRNKRYVDNQSHPDAEFVSDQSQSGGKGTDQSKPIADGTDQSQSGVKVTDQSNPIADGTDQSQTGSDIIEMEQRMEFTTTLSYTENENYDHNYLQNEDKCYLLPPHLHTIDASYSFLFDDIVDALCTPDSSLKFLNLSHATSRKSEISRFWERLNNLEMLEDLNLDGNDLDYIPVDAFSKMHSLKRLSVSENRIMTPSFVIKNLVGLQMLDISRNEVHQLPDRFTNEVDAIAEIQQNFTLYLHGNEFHCDCKNLIFMKWIRDTNAIDRNKALTCRLANGSVIDLLQKTTFYADEFTDLTSEIYEFVYKSCKDSTSAATTAKSPMVILTSILGVLSLILLATIVFLAMKLRRRRTVTTREDLTLS